MAIDTSKWASGRKRDLPAESAALIEKLRFKMNSHIESLTLEGDFALARVKRDSLHAVCAILRYEADLAFNFLIDLTAVDWLDKREERFEVVYHLLSLTHGHRLKIKVGVPEKNPEVESITDLWSAANWLEREVFDMFGIKFTNHPDLRRVLMYDEFEGHPLRKDYPFRKKQPRVPLRYPEVPNTAPLMQRPELVQIRPRPDAKGEGKEQGS